MAFCKHLFTVRKRGGLIIPMPTVARVLSAEGCGSLGGELTRRFGALGSTFPESYVPLVRSRTPGSSAYSIDLLRARSRQPEKVGGAAWMPLEAGGIGFGNSSSQTEMKRQQLRCPRTRHNRHLGLRLRDPCRRAQVEKQNPWKPGFPPVRVRRQTLGSRPALSPYSRCGAMPSTATRAAACSRIRS